jgi:hypothetical protein
VGQCFFLNDPVCFGQLASLRSRGSLVLQSNHLSSTIPVSLRNLTSLGTSPLNGNHLSGVFPQGIGSISSLTQISISKNLLSGSLFPPFSSKAPTSLNVADNLFTGSITATIFSSSQLTIVLASANCLFGSIPETLCYIADNMTILTLAIVAAMLLVPTLNQRIQSH